MRRFDDLATWALLLAGVYVTTSSAYATAMPAPLRTIGITIGLAIVFAAGHVLGARRVLSTIKRAEDLLVDKMPGHVAFHRDDDGHLHALVTTHGGDLRSIAIPDEFADGPGDATRFVFDVLFDVADEDDER